MLSLFPHISSTYNYAQYQILMTVTKYIFPIHYLIIHAICHSEIWCAKEQKIHTLSLWVFFPFVYFTTIFFLFWPWREKFLALFTLLSIVIILIWDCDVQFIYETHSIIIENARKSFYFICLPKMAFWWGRFCPHIDTWWFLNYCRSRCVNKTK